MIYFPHDLTNQGLWHKWRTRKNAKKSQNKTLLKCVDHVIWTGRQMLKLALNFEMFIYFFLFCWIEKKDELLCNFCNKITLSRSWRFPKMHFTTKLKNTTTIISWYWGKKSIKSLDYCCIEITHVLCNFSVLLFLSPTRKNSVTCSSMAMCESYKGPSIKYMSTFSLSWHNPPPCHVSTFLYLSVTTFSTIYDSSP